MDIDQARTFLAVLETGSFMAAADRVHVTQSTVSMRIKTLEEQIGRPLFQRARSGATLTGAGIQFEKYARTIVRAWQQARHEVALPDDLSATLTIGGEFSLWDSLLFKWFPWIRNAVPSMAIRAEAATLDILMRRLGDGLVDIALTYTPQNRAGLTVEELFTDELVFVTSDPEIQDPSHPDYIFVDWGSEFHRRYTQAFPRLTTPRLTVSHGQLGFLHVMENGGAGYFPARMVRSAVRTGRLHRSASLPGFTQPVFVVYGDGRDDDIVFQTALQGVRYVAALINQAPLDAPSP